jgi:L-threonylcarbamoyladenylate synthase
MPIDQAPAALLRAVEILGRGGIIAFPTETYYGLGVDALNAEAVARLVRVKGRDRTKAIACIIGELEQRAQLCASWPETAMRLARRFWPGPLTLVLPAQPGLPEPLRPMGFVGLRLSSNEMARALALALGRPITATSANPAGAPEVTRARDIALTLREQLDLVVDGGETLGGLGSTVVKIDGGRLECLREGAVPYSLCTES